MEDASRHEYFMRQAIVEAEKAVEKDEVPVGAVIVYENRIIARDITNGKCSMTPLPMLK